MAKWLCADCGAKRGVYRLTTGDWHKGRCDLCGESKPLTECADYGYTGAAVRVVRGGAKGPAGGKA